MKKHVYIIGGGVSGLSMAVYLLQKGFTVEIFEQAPFFGGRARQVKIPHQEIDIDNGQHILLGAYKHFIDMVLFLNPNKTLNDLFYLQPLSLKIPNVLQFQANSMNNLASALCSAKGLTWIEKLQFAKLFFYFRHIYDHSNEYNLHNENVRDWLNRIENLSDKLKKFVFEPLCVASMNTPPDQANAQVFLNILRDSLFTFKSFKTSLMIIPKINLSDLFVIPALTYIKKMNGIIHENNEISHLSHLNYQDNLVISAVSPYRLHSLIENISELSDIYEKIVHLQHEAITTIYIQFDTSLELINFNEIIVMLPVLNDENKDFGWWIINKEKTSNQKGLIAIVLSAVDKHKKKTIEEIRNVLNAFYPKMALLNIQFFKVITEKRATILCDTNSYRPHFKTKLKNFYLTGDYINDDYSATLETALRNSKKVLDDILKHHQA